MCQKLSSCRPNDKYPDVILKISSDNTKSLASIKTFIDKIEGILIYSALPLIDQKIRHIKNIANKKYGYVNSEHTIATMYTYVNLLKNNGYTENQILNALNDEVLGNLIPAKYKNIWDGFMENRIKELQEIKNSPPKIENNKPDDQILKDEKNEILHNGDFHIEIDGFAHVHNGFVEATCHILSLFPNSKPLDIESITKEMVLKNCLYYSNKIKDGLVFDDSYKDEFLKSFYSELRKNRIVIYFIENDNDNDNSFCRGFIKVAMLRILQEFYEQLFDFIKYNFTTRTI